MELYFEPMRERRAAEADPDYVEDVLQEGARRAAVAADEVLARAEKRWD